MKSLLCSAALKHLGHLQESLVQFHILIGALIAPLLGRRKGE